jgi:transposase
MMNKKVSARKNDTEIRFNTPFIRTKIIHGSPYLYQITPYYDPVTGKQRQKSKYMGKAEPTDSESIAKKNSDQPPKLKHIVDFGDAYLFGSLIAELNLKKILLKCFPEETVHFILLLVGHRLLSGKPFSYTESWLEESDLLSQYPVSFSLSSQTISRHLAKLGQDEDEALHHFFLHWSQQENTQGENYLFDLTSFSSQAKSIESLESGYNKEHDTIPQINMGLLVNQTKRLPLYYKLYQGSIKDVTTLINLVREFRLLQIKQVTLILDRGFYSQKNLLQLFAENLPFILPLPHTANSLYTKIRKKHEATLDQENNLYLIQDKPVYCLQGSLPYPSLVPTRHQKKIPATVGAEETEPSYTLHYSLYLDKEKQQKEETDFDYELLVAEKILQKTDWNQFSEDLDRAEHWKEAVKSWLPYFTLQRSPNPSNKEYSYQVKRNLPAIQAAKQGQGTMILLHTQPKNPEELLPLYRERDTVEKVFDAGKNELAGLPLRVHKTNTMQGFFFILFISMIVQFYLLDKMKKENMDPKFSVSRIFFELHKLKKAIWLGKEMIINELSKTQRVLLDTLKILLPTNCGN